MQGQITLGKTTLLEALFLHSGAYNPELTLRLNAFRGISEIKVSVARHDESLWDSLFYQFDTSKIVELSGENTVTRRRTLRLKVSPEPVSLSTTMQISAGSRRLTDTPSTAKTVGLPRAIQTLALEYEDDERKGKCTLLVDETGILRVEPVPPLFLAFFQSASVPIPPGEDAERLSNMEIQGKQEVITRR
ncbi:MAG: hypothetical protein ACUVSV_12440 [Armatimonadota bacterium]